MVEATVNNKARSGFLFVLIYASTFGTIALILNSLKILKLLGYDQTPEVDQVGRVIAEFASVWGILVPFAISFFLFCQILRQLFPLKQETAELGRGIFRHRLFFWVTTLPLWSVSTLLFGKWTLDHLEISNYSMELTQNGAAPWIVCLCSFFVSGRLFQFALKRLSDYKFCSPSQELGVGTVVFLWGLILNLVLFTP